MRYIESKWERQPQECQGDCFFNGFGIITDKLQEEVPEEELKSILKDLFRFIQEENGIDYLAVYKRKKDGKKIYIIDESSQWTMMLAEEY